MYAVYEIIITVNTAMLNETKNMSFYKTHNTDCMQFSAFRNGIIKSHNKTYLTK